MNRRQGLFLVLLLTAALILAFPLQGFFRDKIVLPMAQLAWGLGDIYQIVPQTIIWVIMLVVLIFISINSFYTIRLDKKRRSGPNAFQAGSINQMALWIEKGTRGVYFKWRVAHILADLAFDILRRRRGRGAKVTSLEGEDWNPPEHVREYLDAAVKTTYADYPRPNPFVAHPHTPFDRDLEPVIEYLESLLEIDHDHQHS